MVVFGTATVTVLGVTPLHEQALLYLTSSEQADAYAGMDVAETLTWRWMMVCVGVTVFVATEVWGTVNMVSVVAVDVTRVVTELVCCEVTVIAAGVTVTMRYEKHSAAPFLVGKAEPITAVLIFISGDAPFVSASYCKVLLTSEAVISVACRGGNTKQGPEGNEGSGTEQHFAVTGFCRLSEYSEGSSEGTRHARFASEMSVSLLGWGICWGPH